MLFHLQSIHHTMVYLQLHIEQYHWNKLLPLQTRLEAATRDDGGDAIIRISFISTIWTAIFSLNLEATHQSNRNSPMPKLWRRRNVDDVDEGPSRIPPDNFPWIS